MSWWKRSVDGILALGLMAAAQGVSAEAPMIQVSRITLETALAMALQAMASCRAQGIQIGVTVVDRDGQVQVSLRDALAAPITLSVSQRKAFTAVNFNAATSSMAARAETPVGRMEPLLMSPGGLPLQVGGQLVAGIGVSGAPLGVVDEECALAGIAAVKDDLELGRQ